MEIRCKGIKDKIHLSTKSQFIGYLSSVIVSLLAADRITGLSYQKILLESCNE